MITQEFFKKNIADALLLLGSTLKPAAVDVMYDRVKYDFIQDDLRKAIDDIMSPDREAHKLTYPILLKALYRKRSIRYELENEERKAKYADEAKVFWVGEYDATCKTRNCQNCPKVAGRCDTIAKNTMDAIKIMLAREWRPNNPDERLADYYRTIRAEQREYCKGILDELNRQFPGAGFDRPIEHKATITRDELRGYVTPHTPKHETPVRHRADIDDFTIEGD